MRVRVELDITKPLSRGRRVRFGPDSNGWVSFRYERLPVFCYWCGRLTHDAKDCDMWIRSKGKLNVQQQPFGEWMRAPQMNMTRRKIISVVGQQSRRPEAAANTSDSANASVPVTDKPTVLTRTETSTRKESAKSKEILESGDKAEITEILIDNEKFQAHIQEIDDALINGPAPFSVTKSSDDALDCRIDDTLDCRTTKAADNKMTDMKRGGPAVEKLDTTSNMMGCSGGGPSGLPFTNPASKTWKRVQTGPKIISPKSEDYHAGNKRGAQDHANEDTKSVTKKKKIETEVAEVSKLMAVEFTETAVAARQHRRDQ